MGVGTSVECVVGDKRERGVGITSVCVGVHGEGGCNLCIEN